MSNKYLEKISANLPGMLFSSSMKRIATGATIGGIAGAVAAGPDNRTKGAIGGAAVGGLAAGALGRRSGLNTMTNAASKRMAGVSPSALPGPTTSMNPNVIGAPKTGLSPLANRIKFK